MSVLGYSEPSYCTELWREKAITERAFALINAKEWPPPVGWLDDLLSRDRIPPEGDFWDRQSLPSLTNALHSYFETPEGKDSFQWIAPLG